MADGKVTIDSELNDKGLEQGLSNMQKKLEGAGKSLQNVGGKLTKGLTLPIVAAGTGAVMMAMNFDDSMRKVKATMGDGLGKTTKEAEKNFKALSDEAQNLGATTAFSASDAAGAMETLALQGWDTNQILSGTGPILNAASAGGLELAHAAQIVAGNLAAFGLEADKAEWAADMLQTTASNSGTTTAELGEALVTAGGAAANAGMTLDQTNAILGTFANTGLKGGRAGTTFNSMLRDLKDSAKDGTVDFGKFQVKLYDTNGEMKDMGSVLGEMEKGMEGMSQAQKDAAIDAVFGSQAQQGVNNILGQGVDVVKDLEEAMKNGAGASQRAADEIEGGIGGAFRSLSSATEGLAIAFGNVIAPAVEKVAKVVIDLLGRFTKLSEEKKKLIVVVGAVLAAIGPLLVVLGTIISVVAKVAGAFALITPPIMIAIAVFAAIIAIGVLLWQNWATLKEKAIEVFSHFTPLLDTMKEAFGSMMDSVGPILESLKTLWESLVPILEIVAGIIGGVLVVAFGVVISVITAVIAAIGPFINAIINIADIVLNMVNVVVALLTGDFAGAFEYLQQIGESTKDFFVNMFTAIVDFISTFVKTIIDFFHGLYMTLVGNSIIPDIVNEIVDWFKNMVTWVVDLVKNIVKGVTAGFKAMSTAISSVMSAIGSVISTVWNTIRSVITSVVNGIRSVVSSVFNAIRSVISSVMSGISSTISSVWNGIRNTISSVTNSIKTTISSIFNSLASIVTGAMGKVTSAVKTGIGKAYTAVTDKVKDFFNAGKNIVGAIADGITASVGKAMDAIGGVVSKVRDFLPFSPAKEGPLKTLDKLDFGGPISDSIDAAIPDVQAQMNAMLKMPSAGTEASRAPKVKKDNGTGTLVQIMSEQNKILTKLLDKNPDLHIDGEKVTDMVNDINAIKATVVQF